MQLDLKEVEVFVKMLDIRALKLLPNDIKPGVERLLMEETDATGKTVLGKDSRGALFREDFPQCSALEASAYTKVRLAGEKPQVKSAQVAFTRVRPGQSLLKPQAAE